MESGEIMKFYQKIFTPELQKIYEEIGMHFIYSENLTKNVNDPLILSQIYQMLYMQYNLLKLLNSEVEETLEKN